ncbi:hypothetical protein [Paraburkholderia fungorum]|uniref:hypothetical protein n=1 Tax=Paraburkholderia fungorum TaxID=134537 RepID=UPI0038BD72C9
MFTFIFVVAVAAFVPYVAAPGIANGVKAVTQPAPAAAVRFEIPPPAAGGGDEGGNDAANRIVAGPPDGQASV